MKSEVFRIPEGYFEQLPAQVEARIARLEGNVFEVPPQYFEGLPQQIEAKIAPVLPEAGELEEILPTPPAYFANLHHQIIRKVNASKQAGKAVSWQGWRVVQVAGVGLAVFLGVYFTRPQTAKQAQNLPAQPEKKEIIATPKPKKQAEKTTIKEEIAQNPAPSVGKVEILPVNLPAKPDIVLAPAQYDSLSHYLAKADQHTQDALTSLTEEEDAAGEDEDEEWHETHEKILQEIHEELIIHLPHLLNKKL